MHKPWINTKKPVFFLIHFAGNQAPTTPPARMPSSAKYLWLKTPTPGSQQPRSNGAGGYNGN